MRFHALCGLEKTLSNNCILAFFKYQLLHILLDFQKAVSGAMTQLNSQNCTIRAVEIEPLMNTVDLLIQQSTR